MTEEQAIEAICAAWVAAWPAASGNVPYALPNEAVVPTADSYAAIVVQYVAGRQVTHGRAGNRRIERRGTILVKLWAAAGAGMTRSPAEVTASAPLKMAELITAARNIFELVALGPAGSERVHVEAGTPTPPVVDGRWIVTRIALPFTVRDFK